MVAGARHWPDHHALHVRLLAHPQAHISGAEDFPEDFPRPAPTDSDPAWKDLGDGVAPCPLFTQISGADLDCIARTDPVSRHPQVLVASPGPFPLSCYQRGSSPGSPLSPTGSHLARTERLGLLEDCPRRTSATTCSHARLQRGSD